MTDERPTLTLPDGTPLGKVTNFQTAVAVTGDVYLLEALKPCDVTPSKMTIPISGMPMGCYDPFGATPEVQPAKPNRKQRRKR